MTKIKRIVAQRQGIEFKQPTVGFSSANSMTAPPPSGLPSQSSLTVLPSMKSAPLPVLQTFSTANIPLLPKNDPSVCHDLCLF